MNENFPPSSFLIHPGFPAPPGQLSPWALRLTTVLIYTKVLVASCVLALTYGAIGAQTRSGRDSSLLRPSDGSYAEATEFAQFLDQHGIAVKSIHRSKLEAL